MAIKIYELTRMKTAFFITKYLEHTVELPFTSGRGNGNECRAEYVTGNKFIQDAIEHDARFGHDFVLTNTYKTAEEIAKEEEDARKAEELANAVVEPIEEEKPKKKAKKSNSNEVLEVRTLNDAFDYFANLGIAVDSKDQLEQTMRELKVSFPNLEE